MSTCLHAATALSVPFLGTGHGAVHPSIICHDDGTRCDKCAAYTAILDGCVATPFMPAYFNRSTSTADTLSSVHTTADM